MEVTRSEQDQDVAPIPLPSVPPPTRPPDVKVSESSAIITEELEKLEAEVEEEINRSMKSEDLPSSKAQTEESLSPSKAQFPPGEFPVASLNASEVTERTAQPKSIEQSQHVKVREPDAPKIPLKSSVTSAKTSVDSPVKYSAHPDIHPDRLSQITEPSDDGWEAIWEPNHNAYYFFNRFSQETTWTNPRVPQNFDETLQDEPEILSENAPNLESMSTYEKYKYYEQLKQQQDSSDPHAHVESNAQVQARMLSSFNSNRGVTSELDLDDPSVLVNLQSNGKSLKSERSGAKVTKKDLERYKKMKQERKAKKLKEWLAR